MVIPAYYHGAVCDSSPAGSSHVGSPDAAGVAAFELLVGLSAAGRRLAPATSSGGPTDGNGQRFIVIKSPPPETADAAAARTLVVVVGWIEELKRKLGVR